MEEISKRTLRLIKKSLALAGNNPNPEEAQTAMLKAQELMAKHGLSMSDVQIEAEEKKTSESIVDYMKLSWWHKELADIIAENFRCYKYWSLGGRMARMKFFGLETDTVIAKEVYLFALSVIKFYANQYIKQNGIKGRSIIHAVKNDYIIGFLNGLREKFKEQVESNGWGLILVKDALVIREHEQKEIKIVKPATRTVMGDMLARHAGYEEGKRFDHRRKGIEMCE